MIYDIITPISKTNVTASFAILLTVITEGIIFLDCPTIVSVKETVCSRPTVLTYS